MSETRYIVGRYFKSHEGTHTPGDAAPESAAQWHNLHQLVASGLLYAVVEDEGYTKLPPHVFNAVRTRQEVLGIIERGDQPLMTIEWEPSYEYQKSVELNEAERRSVEQNKADQEQNAGQFFDKISEVTPSPRAAEEEIMDRPSTYDSKHQEAIDAAAEVEPAGIGENSDPAETGEYSEMTKEELVEEIKKRNEQKSEEAEKIVQTGNKAELVSRLEEDDKS